MFRCIYKLIDFESSNGEHIIQNFLGARWVSDNIVCNDLQSVFGATIDSALEGGLKPIRNFLGTKGGRGDGGPTLKGLPVSSGETLDLEPGGRPRLNRPTLRQLGMQDGKILINAKLGNIQQLEWALAQIRELHPGGRIDKRVVEESIQYEEAPIEGMITMQLNLGGDEYFRGALKACFNLLGVKYPNEILKPCFNAVREFIRDGVGHYHDFIRGTASTDRLSVPNLGTSDQAVFIISRDNYVEGVVQFFGEIVHPIRLTNNYDGPVIHCGYVVDPFRNATPAEDRHPNFDDDSIPTFADQLLIDDPQVESALKTRIQRILTLYYKQSQQHIIKKTITEVMAENGGEYFTLEIVREISNRLAARLMGLPIKHNRPPKHS